MYEKILVPLDGSKVAEGILPWVGSLARGLGSSVTLLSVVGHADMENRGRPFRRSGPAVAQIAERAMDAYHRRYLENAADYLLARGVGVKPLVVVGDPVEEILGQAAASECDLIAMSTHGRSGLHRGLVGSVTDSVIRSSQAPVLVANPSRVAKARDREADIKKIVVPLDGSHLSETVLPYVEELADRLSLDVILVHSINVPPSLSQKSNAAPNRPLWIPAFAGITRF